MADLLSAGERWLAGVHRTSCATLATYARGALSVAVGLTLGGSVTVAYGNAAVLTATRKVFVPAADLVLGGLSAKPATGDSLTWLDTDSLIPRVLVLGPWGPDRLPGRLVEASQTWEAYAQEVGELVGRKSTPVTLERPLASPARNSYGETVGDRFEVVATVNAEVTPLTATEDVQAGKLLETSKYLVFVNTSKAITNTWRVHVRAGDLHGRYLYVETVTPLAGFVRELMLVCRLGGA